MKAIIEWLIAKLVGFDRLERLAAAIEGGEEY